jgi:hypothetical protein
METANNIIGTLEAILARVEDNIEKAVKILHTKPGHQNQRVIDYAEGVNFGLEIARNEIKAEIEIVKQVHNKNAKQ